jgi:hypothetical protein
VGIRIRALTPQRWLLLFRLGDAVLTFVTLPASRRAATASSTELRVPCLGVASLTSTCWVRCTAGAWSEVVRTGATCSGT